MPQAIQGRSRRRGRQTHLLRQLADWAKQLQRRVSRPASTTNEDASLTSEAVICLAIELRRFQRSPTANIHTSPKELGRHLLRIADARWHAWLGAALQLTNWLSAVDDYGVNWSTIDGDWLGDLRKSIDQVASAEQPYESGEFYERLLAAQKRDARGSHGVYYTPAPLAEFLVTLADQQLIEVGFANGILDESVDDSGSPCIQIVDPAAGSGAFITAVLRVARRLHDQRRPDESWQAVADGLLRRLGANELMPVAAAIGQLRTIWQLLETGYSINDETLADWVAVDTLRDPSPACLAHRGRPSVVLGNPPYQSAAVLDGGWIEQQMRGVGEDGSFDLTQSYFAVNGEPLKERKIWLHDAYVRFLRWAQWCVEAQPRGVVSLVLNHGLLDNLTFRGVREKLVKHFNEVHVLDLHGSTKARERSPDGSPDENVFEIATGVAAICLTKGLAEPGEKMAHVWRADLWGSRDDKISQLVKYAHAPPPWERVSPAHPEYLLQRDRRVRSPEFEAAPSLPELMPLQSTAPVTARDRFLIDRDRESLVRRLNEFADLSISDDTIRGRHFQRTRSKKYLPGDTRGWKLSEARRRLSQTKDWQQHIRTCLYRPFDWRYILWLDWMIDWPRPELSGPMIGIDNIALIARRQMLPGQPCNYFWATRHIAIDGVIRSDNRGSESLFPLWRLDDSGERVANFDARWIEQFESRAELRWMANKRGDLQHFFGAEDLLGYIYGLFFTPEYRDRYADWLRREFPRVILPSGRRQFAQLAQAGQQLLHWHTATSSDPPLPSIDKVPRLKNYVPGNGKATEEDFRVGGYEVVRKWLRQRGKTKPPVQDEEFEHMLGVIRSTNTLVQRDLSNVTFDASNALDYC